MGPKEAINVPSIMPSGRPMDYISVNTSPSMFGADVGRAIAGLGGTIADVGAAMSANSQRLATEQAKIDANSAFMDFSIKKGAADAEFATTAGTNAVSAYPAYLERLAAIRKEAADGLGTDEAKALFEEDSQTEFLSGINNGATHAAKQQAGAVIASAEGRLALIQEDSLNKFGDDNLFKTNLQKLDQIVIDIGSAKGWDDVTVLNKQFEQRSLAWKYRITAMANTDPMQAQKLFGEVRDGLTAETRLDVEKTITSALSTRGAANMVNSVYNGAKTMATPTMVNSHVAAGIPPNVRLSPKVAGGSHSTASMQPRAYQILHGTAAAAAAMGITLEITAAEGGGHLSHGEGTEWDLKGYHADGRLWTPGERAQVARGGAAAGANRFGLYSFGEGYRGNGSLHIGYAGEGRPSAVWGASGFTGGAESRNFYDPSEQQFLADFNAGSLGASRGIPAGSFAERIRDLGERGKVGDRSPVGALGVMQVLPSTARQVAAQLGIPYDAHRLQYDVEYGMLIGTTYLNQLLEMYQGDEVLVSAAYNGGMGNVNKWLEAYGDPRTGTISHEEWIAKIPFDETRNYVTRVMSGGGGTAAPSGAGPVTASGFDQGTYTARRQEIMDMAEFYQPGNVLFVNQAVSEFDTLWNSDKKAYEDAQSANYDAVLAEVIDSDNSGNLPSTREQLLTSPEMLERWNALDPAKQQQIDSALARNVSEEKNDIDGTIAIGEYERLLGLSKTDWAAFTAENIAGNELLTLEYRKQLVDMRLKGQEATKGPIDVDVQKAIRLSTSMILAAGVNAKDDADRWNSFYGALTRSLHDFADSNQRKPTGKEMREITAQLLMESGRTKDGGFWPWSEDIPLLNFESGIAPKPFAAEVIESPTTMTAEQRAALITVYQKKYPGQTPTAAELAKMYANATKGKKTDTGVPR